MSESNHSLPCQLASLSARGCYDNGRPGNRSKAAGRLAGPHHSPGNSEPWLQSRSPGSERAEPAGKGVGTSCERPGPPPNSDEPPRKMSQGLTACQALLCTLGAKPVLFFGAGILMGVCVRDGADGGRNHGNQSTGSFVG